MARKIEVQIVGDASKLNKAFKSASKNSDSFGKKMASAGKFAALGLGAGIAVAAVALKKSVDAALEAEKAQTRLDSAFKATNASAKERAASMAAVNKVSVQAGLDDEDLMDTLGRLSRVTGDVSKAQNGMSIAADLARGRGLELGAATKIVEKAYLGNVGALKRIGIEIPKVTVAQDALKTSHEKVTKAQMDSAKAADDAATRQAAIAALQKQYGGAAEAYGKTAAGAQDRFKVAVENLQESVGAKLLPVLTRLLTWFVGQLPAIERITKQVMGAVSTAIDFVRKVSEVVWPKVQEAAQKVVAWYRGTLAPAIQNVVTAVTAIWNRFGGDITRIAKTAFALVSTVVRNALTIVQAIVETVLAVIRGDWGEAWNGLKKIVSTSLNSIGAIIKGFAKIAFTAAMAIGAALVDGIVAGITGLAQKVGAKIKEGITGAVGWAGGVLKGSGDFMFTKHAIGKPMAEGIGLGFIDAMKKVNAVLLGELTATGKQLAAISQRRANEDRAAAVTEAIAALAAARKKKEGVVAAERDLARAREDVVVAGLEKTLAKEQAIYDRRQTLLQKKMDKLNATIQRAQDKAAEMFGKMQSKLLAAFDAETGGHKTPAEMMLASIQDKRAQADLDNALKEAIAGGDPAAILKAQEDIQIAGLEKTAANERKAYEDQRNLQREQLDERIANLQNHFTKEGTTVANALAKINEIMRAFGITFAESGQLVGLNFVKGLVGAIGGAAQAAGGVSGAKTGGSLTPPIPPIVTNLILDGKTVASVVRQQNVVYQKQGGTAFAV